MRIDVSFLLIVAGVFDIAGPLLANGQYYHYPGDKNFTTCFYDKFKDYSGASPTSRSQTCDSASPFVTNSSECLYFYLRRSFSKLYDTFPYNMFFPRAPDIGNLPILNASADTYNFTPATSEEMVQGTKAIQLFLKCGQPFSVLCGGHSNAGASIVLGKRVLSVRHLNAVKTTLKADAVFDDEFDGSKMLGSSFVGAGSTAGRAMALTYEGKYFVALPVGQKPSVGMSGITFGGGIGSKGDGNFLIPCFLSFVWQTFTPTNDFLVTANEGFSDITRLCHAWVGWKTLSPKKETKIRSGKPSHPQMIFL